VQAHVIVHQDLEHPCVIARQPEPFTGYRLDVFRAQRIMTVEVYFCLFVQELGLGLADVVEQPGQLQQSREVGAQADAGLELRLELAEEAGPVSQLFQLPVGAQRVFHEFRIIQQRFGLREQLVQESKLREPLQMRQRAVAVHDSQQFITDALGSNSGKGNAARLLPDFTIYLKPEFEREPDGPEQTKRVGCQRLRRNRYDSLLSDCLASVKRVEQAAVRYPQPATRTLLSACSSCSLWSLCLNRTLDFAGNGIDCEIPALQVIKDSLLAETVEIQSNRDCPGFPWGLSRNSRSENPGLSHLPWTVPTGEHGNRGSVPMFPQLQFADYLFQQADYDRAIGEYRRVMFSDSLLRPRQYAQFMTAEAYYRKGDYSAARNAFQDALSVEFYELGYLGMARCLLQLGRYNAARHYAATVRDSTLLKAARVIQAGSYYRQHDFPAGRAMLAGFARDSALGGLQRHDGRDTPSRSRTLSTALSAVIPGLGQTYSGRLGDGVYSFLVVGTAAAVSYYYWSHPEQDRDHVKFGIVAGLGLLFHAGNIYGANIAARDFNRLKRREYLSRVQAVLDQVDLQPDYRQLILNSTR